MEATSGGAKSEKPTGVAGRARTSPWRAVPMEEAFTLIEENIPMGTCKFVNATLAKPGQVLASPVLARANVPQFHTSIKDGYAVIASDPSETRQVVRAQVAEACTHPDQQESGLQPGECIRVCTGSVLPRGSDAVVMVEQTELVEYQGSEEKVIRILSKVKEGQDVRVPGADMREGDVILEARTVLTSAEIGLLAANSKRDIEVYRKPRVCVMSTGDELLDCSMDEALSPGQVRDSNRPQLMALFASRGFKAIDAGIINDTREALVEGIRVAFKFASIVVTTGGVSMGEKDLMKDVLQKDFGFKIHFGRVWMKPGLPATFATGTVEDAPCAVFALPGNPVSSWVCSELFAVPALRRMAGHSLPYQNILKVQALSPRPDYYHWLERISCYVFRPKPKSVPPFPWVRLWTLSWWDQFN